MTLGTPPNLDTSNPRKDRGAFFTPEAIADYLAAWAIDGNPEARVLDPTCGEGVFLLTAGRRLRRSGREERQLKDQLFGVDVHRPSVLAAHRLLRAEGVSATILEEDFFALPTRDQLGSSLPEMDAVIGNPPFVRYQQHTGKAREKAAQAALRQGIRLSGLASSWAATLVHACAFLKPEGRLAMVLPTELLTVHYAEPIRRWLRQRFAAVHLVMFNHLQFVDALEKVVLLVAQGNGGCESFSLYEVDDARDLPTLRPFDHFNITPPTEGKWTDAFLSARQRHLFRTATEASFTPLENYGRPELGTVTGANAYFALTESTRLDYKLSRKDVRRVCPPGTKHLRGFRFTGDDWETLRDEGFPVWLLAPEGEVNNHSHGLRRYLSQGEKVGVPDAYKCRIREPWWRPPVVPAPDLFFTYMSHRFPRLITNQAGVTFLNSMHGIRLRDTARISAKVALPLLSLNAVTLLGAEVFGRSYGGGILKMEPREAARLPVPGPSALEAAWERLRTSASELEAALVRGDWEAVTQRVNEGLLGGVMGLSTSDIVEIEAAATRLRGRRLRR